MTTDATHVRSDSGLQWLLPSVRSLLEPIVPGPEHRAAVLARWHRDGLVHPLVDDVYVAAPWARVPAARCAAMALLLREGGAIGMASSVWARGGPGRAPLETIRPPEGVHDRDDHEVDLLLPPQAGRSRTRDGVRTRRLPFRDDEIEHLHGVPLTRRLRTAVDLVMWGTERDQAALDWLWRGGVEPDAVRADLSARRSNAWIVRGLRVLARVRADEVAPLAAEPLTDPATTWARNRNGLSRNASR